MPPKRKTGSSAAASKKKKAAPDWRQPVFYWRGKVEGTTWEGTWVSSIDGLPSDEEFATSTNTFKLECRYLWTLALALASCPHAPSSHLHASSKPLGTVYKHKDEAVTFTGHYKLDNGGGPADYSDVEHNINAFNGPPEHHPATHGWAVVGACGNTEFGRFVSLGRLDKRAAGEVSGEEEYTRLTLARRYVDDDDPRAGMSAEDVRKRITGYKAPDEGVIDVPWLALPWKVPDNLYSYALTGASDECKSLLPTFPPHIKMLLEANCEEEECDWMVGLGPACE